MRATFVRRMELVLFVSASVSALNLFPDRALSQVISSVELAVSMSEVYPQLGFNKLGFEAVTSASSANVSGSSNATTTMVDADYTFVIDGDTFTGTGSFLSTEIGGVLDIDISLTLTSGNREISYVYSQSGDLNAGTRTETVDATLTVDAVVDKEYSITKTETEVVSPGSVSTSISATATVEGITRTNTIAINETIVSPTVSNFSNTYLDERVSPSGPPLLLEADYQTVINASEEITLTFSKYTLSSDGDELLALTGPSTIKTVRTNDDLYDVLIDINVGSSSFGVVNLSVASPVQLTRLVSLQTALGEGDDGWSWSDFGKTVAASAGGGAGAGAAASLLTDSAAPVTAGPAAAIGGAAGAVGGAVGYCISKAWDAIFSGPPLKVPPGGSASCMSETFFEGIIQVDQDASGTIEVTTPSSVPSVSKWGVLVSMLLLAAIAGMYQRRMRTSATCR